MSTEKKSIFKLGDKFGIESPLGDWMEDARARREEREREREQRDAESRDQQVRRNKEEYQENSGTPIINRDGCDSMLVLSQVVEPKDGKPGSAHIDINMEYRVVTVGVGAVSRRFFNPVEFNKLYRTQEYGVVGNRTIKLKHLPSKDEEAWLLSEKERYAAKKVVKKTGKRKFWEYYDTTVQYNFSLDKEKDLSLFDAFYWMNQCVESRGVIFLSPYRISPYKEALEAWEYAEKQDKKQDISALKIDLKKEYLQKGEDVPIYSKDELVDILASREREATDNVRAQFVAPTIKYLIENPLAFEFEFGRPSADNVQRITDANLLLKEQKKFKNSNIITTVRARPLVKASDTIRENNELKTFLNQIGSTLHFHNERDEKIRYVELDTLRDFYGSIRQVERFVRNLYIKFKYAKNSHFKKSWEESTGDTAAAGSNYSLRTHQNFILLNPVFFGEKETGIEFKYQGMTETEVVVHEAGHNAAEKFIHQGIGGDYEYKQEGLQSSDHGKVHPTLRNTFDIINDPTNRKNMKRL